MIRSVIATVVVLPAFLCAQSVAPHQHHMASGADSANQPAVVAGLKIPDIVLLNQRGEKVHFYSDLIAGRVVVINTIFTSCTTICPLMGANFAKLHKLLNGADGRKVNLISISVDPLVDTPQRLDEWSRGFGPATPGWTLLTGSKPDVDAVLKALQVFTADKQEHAPVALIGGDGAGEWARASALLPPAQLAGLVRARMEQAATHSLPRF